MPFLGLLKANKKELDGGGYHRLDMSEITFRCSPAESHKDHFEFLNQFQIEWPAAETNWPSAVYIAVFLEIDDCDPIMVYPLGQARKVSIGDSLAIRAGALRIPTKLKEFTPT